MASPDWKWLDQDGGKNNIGSVYRVNKNNTVHEAREHPLPTGHPPCALCRIINRDWTVKVTSYSARAIDTDVRKKRYSDEPSIDHCVAVISFGKEVQVLQKYSNDYSNMLHILDDIECEGPSSLKQALMAAYPFLRSGNNCFII
uniref:Uncharacterized protein n=1 Tax=Magallana gigas TaxID=29159 RepID=K1R088_MAGGI